MSELPKGWIKTKLSVVGNTVTGNTPPRKNPEYYGGNVPFVKPGDIDIDKELIHTDETLSDRGCDKARVLKKGSVLVTCIGNIGRVGLATKPMATNQQINAIEFNDLILPKYGFHYCRTLSGWLNFNASATTVAIINKSKFSDAPFILAPLAEQKRIVEKLDEVLAQVDTIKARLDGIPAILKRFRQSVLASAVSGKLTEDSNADWVGCHLSDVSTFQNGYAFKSGWFSDEGDYQVIKLGNVKDDFLKLDAAPAYLSSKLGLEHIKFKPEIGDILLSMTGTKFKRDYGFCCMVDRELPILINQRVGRIIPKRDKVTPDFLHLFLRSEVFRNQFFAGETGGVNQGNVGSKHIMAIQLSVPDLELQIEIAKKARLLFTFADTIEAQVKKAQARVDNLTQSILAKAFRGELVAQDPNDEPADKLLERIAQARKEAEALAKAAKKAEATKKKAAKSA
ncbi:TPA: restriction endonuclease subunit S [Vibrio vulnificus]|nr:type I restriction endonuclease subunit S [Vibrio vulnificus]HDZ3735451.1 restriction endonuclease subunit S [Vibrio vulnificus]HEB2775528.1 restriction endonuclease subunit S [Vibrio vulnificus]